MINIGSIAVKDKYEILQAAEILDQIGIQIFSSEEIKQKCLTWDDIDNNYLMQDPDGWRIQSHLMQEKFNLTTLDQFVTQLLVKHPNLKAEVERIATLKKEITTTQEELTQQMAAELAAFNNKFNA